MEAFKVGLHAHGRRFFFLSSGNNNKYNPRVSVRLASQCNMPVRLSHDVLAMTLLFLRPCNCELRLLTKPRISLV